MDARPISRGAGLDGFEFFFEQLFLIQIGVVASAHNQLGVCALFGHHAMLDDEDLAGVPDGGDAVGDQNGGAPAHDIFEALENALFGEGVDARERVIEDQDLGIAQDGARNGDALLLAAG
jgi:hypothetical protein